MQNEMTCFNSKGKHNLSKYTCIQALSDIQANLNYIALSKELLINLHFLLSIPSVLFLTSDAYMTGCHKLALEPKNQFRYYSLS